MAAPNSGIAVEREAKAEGPDGGGVDLSEPFGWNDRQHPSSTCRAGTGEPIRATRDSRIHSPGIAEPHVFQNQFIACD